MAYGDRGGGGFRAGGRGFGGPREMHDAECSFCGRPTQLPIKPLTGRPIYCHNCFRERRPRRSFGEFVTPDAPVTFEEVGAIASDGSEISQDSLQYKQVIVEVQGISNDVMRMLRRNPEMMRSLTSRQFEELVAEMFTRLGYQVELTPPTKDGGFDIAAAKRADIGSFLYLVECKRYQPTHKVGVELVRSLYGVVESHGATGGVMVTTSFFTKPACELQKTLEYRMNLCDYNKLQEWLWNDRGSRQSH